MMGVFRFRETVDGTLVHGAGLAVAKKQNIKLETRRMAAWMMYTCLHSVASPVGSSKATCRPVRFFFRRKDLPEQGRRA